MLFVSMFYSKFFSFCKSKSDLRSKPCVGVTTLFSTHFPLIRSRKIGAFTSPVFWFSIKSVYTKHKNIPERRPFGKSAETLIFSPMSSFSMWMPKDVSLPGKLRIFGMFPSCSMFHESSEYSARVRYYFFCTNLVLFFFYGSKSKPLLSPSLFQQYCYPLSPFFQDYFYRHPPLLHSFVCHRRRLPLVFLCC